MTRNMTITPLHYHEINGLEMLQPEGWLDIRRVFNLHHGRSYFSGYKGMIDGVLASVGHVIYCTEVAWLGNVIVHPLYRRKGWGTIMTEFLIKKVHKKGIATIYLLATEMGRLIYEKLGFITHSLYAFNDIRGKIENTQYDPIIRRSEIQDWPHVLKLDHDAMGYDRSDVLNHFREDTWVYDDGRVKGFYVKSLGDGLIIANDQVAGWALSEMRIKDGKSHLVIPEGQQVPLSQIYETNQFQLNKQERIAYFMYLGLPPDYIASMIYSRIGGYLG